MQPYSNLNGSSGVIAFKAGTTYIDVQFQDGSVYRYTYAVTGRSYVEEMKRLALSGKGLSTYISRHVKNNYAAKLQ